MKKYIALFIGTILFFSCQKNDISDDLALNKANQEKLAFISKVKNSLKTILSPEDFESLDWEKINTKKVNAKSPYLRIASKLENNKFLYYYSNLPNTETYNWVTYKLNTINKITSGTITIDDATKALVREVKITNNKIVSYYDASPSAPVGSVVTMDEVIVTGTIGQQNIFLISLWWLSNLSSFAGQYESFPGNYTQEQQAPEQSGGGGDPIIIVTIDSVNNSLTDTCMLEAYNKISTSTLTNFISKLYQKTFVGVSKNHNLSIEPTSSIQDPITGNQLAARSFRESPNSDTWVIELNTGFAGQLTQEIWGSIIIHELIHGFIQKNELDFNPQSLFTNAHEIILSEWITQMQECLVESFGIPPSDALALSLEGLDDVLKNLTTNTFKSDMTIWVQQNYSINLAAASNIADDYYTGVKGIKCL